MARSKREILDNLLSDTESDKIRWEVTIEKKLVKAIYEKVITPSKNIFFKIVYYIDHPKSTKLHIYFKKHNKHGSESETIFDLGGNKKKNESKYISQILNKILLKEEKLRDQVHLDLDGVFKIGDRVVVAKEQDFQKSDIIGQKGTIVNTFTRNDNEVFLVEFDKKFSSLLINNDFNFDSKCVDGNCWIMYPENIEKISK